MASAADACARSLDDLTLIDPITCLDDLRLVAEHGHPVLHDVTLPDWTQLLTGTQLSAVQGESGADRMGRYTTHTLALDRLRALELVHLATTVLALAFASPDSRDRLDALFPDDTDHAPGASAGDDAAGAGAGEEAGVAGPLDSSYDADPSSFCNHAEYVLTTGDEAAIAARTNARTGLTRKHIGHALTAYIGMPLLLRAVLEGRARFNRWEGLIRKFAWLPLGHLRALDVFLTTLDERISLHQFMRKASQFIAELDVKPILAARANRGRRAWVEDLPGGQSILCAKGPTALVHAHFNEAQALSRALVKNQVKLLDITHAQAAPVESADTAASGEGEIEGAATGTDTGAGSAATTRATPAGGDASTESVELPPVTHLSVDDERMIQQLTFDTLIKARPRTHTVLEAASGAEAGTDDATNGTAANVDAAGGGTDAARAKAGTDNAAGAATVEGAAAAGDGVEAGGRYRVEVSLPDDASILRKHATVVVTVPMTTLMGLDDRPGMIADTPVPADMARTIASTSTVWYRMLTDPSTGRVLDHVAHRYEPDRATRIAVASKWQTCTAPGCARPARHCDLDHGVPFDHNNPERGGRTEPANLHPLCRRHHQAKTAGRLRMRRITADEIEWVLPLGTTSTTLAPAVDDGGILTDACHPEDTPARTQARDTLHAHLSGRDDSHVSDDSPVSGDSDATGAQPDQPPGESAQVLSPEDAYAQVWADYLAEEKLWDEHVEQVRARQHTVLKDARDRFQAWKDSQLASLENRISRENEARTREWRNIDRERDRNKRDWRLLAASRAALSEHMQACNLTTPTHKPTPLSMDAPETSTLLWKTTIVPTLVETFRMDKPTPGHPGQGPTMSVHTPLISTGIRVAVPQPSHVEAAFAGMRDTDWTDHQTMTIADTPSTTDNMSATDCSSTNDNPSTTSTPSTTDKPSPTGSPEGTSTGDGRYDDDPPPF
jgi:hypothetical protein